MFYRKLTTKRILIIIVVIVCIAVVGFFWYVSEKKRREFAKFKEGREVFEKEGEYEKLPLEEELLPYPKYPWIGEYPFRVSSGKEIYPKFKSGKFSKRPMDFIVREDRELEALIKIEDPDEVLKVRLVIIGHKDDLKKEVELKLSEGDSFSGTWSATLNIPEDFKRIFWTNFYAESKSGKEESLRLDWRPGATCAFAKGNIATFGSGGCNIASDETCGSETGEVTVTGTVNLSGTESHPAYLIFGIKVTFSGGKIVLSPHVNEKPTAIIIKAGRTDSFFGVAAHIYVKDADGDGYYSTVVAGKYPAGSCVYQSASEDLYNDCTTATPPNAGSCKSGLCNGAGACAYLTGEQGQPVCKRCSGSSYDPVNVTDDTQDDEGLKLCTATCKKCSGGNCVNQSNTEDLFTHCTSAEPPNPGSCGGDLCNGEGGCQAYSEGEGGQPACKRCNGTSPDPVNITDNTQDSEGTNTCTAICKKCSGGSCVNQTSSEDLFSQCPTGTCKTGNCSGGEGCGWPSDDSGCGTIVCDGLDTTCCNYHNLTSNRCKGLGVCKEANSADCADYTASDDWVSCGTNKVCIASNCVDKVSLSGTLSGSLDYSGKAVIIESGNTVTVQAYNGSSYGNLTITATAIKVVGTITASGKGYGGGGGGGGGGAGGDGSAGGGGSGGSGTAGGSNGNNGAAGSGCGAGGNGGSGGGGGGSYGGSGGSAGAGNGPCGWCNGCHGGAGGAGNKGGYATSQGQGDSSTDESLLMGSGGAGGGGGGGSREPQTGTHGTGGSGSGAGNPGGGWIKLYGSNSITISGSILAKGNSAGTGNGVQNPGGFGPTAGSAGGSASASGSSAGGAAGCGQNCGGPGGNGAAGAGGGVLLKAPSVSLTGSYVIDNRGGGNDTGNGGTVKIFYQGIAPDTSSIYKGRLYTTTY